MKTIAIIALLLLVACGTPILRQPEEPFIQQYNSEVVRAYDEGYINRQEFMALIDHGYRYEAARMVSQNGRATSELRNELERNLKGIKARRKAAL